MKYLELIYSIIVAILSIVIFIWIIVDKADIIVIILVGALVCFAIYLLYTVLTEEK